MKIDKDAFLEKCEAELKEWTSEDTKEWQALVATPIMRKVLGALHLEWKGLAMGVAKADLGSPEGIESARRSQSRASGLAMAIEELLDLTNENIDG